MIPTWTYVKGTDGLYVNLFIGSTINVEKVAGTDVADGAKDRLSLERQASPSPSTPRRPRRFTVYVRVPNRTTSELYTATPQVSGLHSLAVNGTAVTPKMEQGLRRDHPRLESRRQD